MMRKQLLAIFILLLALPVITLGYLQLGFGRKLPKEQLNSYVLHSEIDGLEVHFYGTACFYIGYGKQGILTDPFFSNPSAFETFFYMRPDTVSIAKAKDLPWKNVRGILCGHAHFDHCLELEGALERAEKDIVTVGNTSLFRLFPDLLDTPNFINADTYRSPIYLADSTIRIYPVVSSHSPHFGKTILADGDMKEPVEKQPANWLRWKRGTNYSYLVDFMAGDSIGKRVFFNGGDNLFPQNEAETALLAEKKADLLIIPYWNAAVMEGRVANAQEVFGPSTVIFCHWNNFFQAHEKPLQYIAKSDLPNGLPALQKQFPDMKMHIMLPRQSEYEESRTFAAWKVAILLIM